VQLAISGQTGTKPELQLLTPRFISQVPPPPPTGGTTVQVQQFSPESQAAHLVSVTGQVRSNAYTPLQHASPGPIQLPFGKHAWALISEGNLNNKTKIRTGKIIEEIIKDTFLITKKFITTNQ
jgi:hypothetical protein